MYNISQMAKLLNISKDTLRRWDKDKILVAKRRKSGHRYYSHEQFLEASGKEKYKKDGSNLDAIRGKVVLITGGTGTLGNALTERISDVAKKVIIFSRCELKQHRMRMRFYDKNNIRYLIGDVRDNDRLKLALKKVDVCIHAACMKRIETCTYNPAEAIKNNIIGSVNVVNSCIYNEVKKILMVSTDKACSAGTLYGGTKFVSEQMFIGANNYTPKDKSIFTCVRYGNIYGSNGSIKHIFDKQAKENNEIGITHEEVSRFFMSIDDAVNLILYALNKCIGGEIFVPKMKAIRIMDFANILYPNVPKKIIGLRGYEKIHEELISETESRYIVECNEKYYKIIPPYVSIPGLGWDSGYPVEKLMKPFRYTSDSVEKMTSEELRLLDND